MVNHWMWKRLANISLWGALLNFVTADRPELLFAIKEVLRASSKPGTEDLRRLKRILRFLKGFPRMVVQMPWEEFRPVVTVAVDSDFAGCRETRKSTCGGCILRGRALIKAWSKTLPTLMLSTGEAELGALVKGATEGEGFLAILHDFDMAANIVMESDASAAIGITQRQGLGKIRHLAVADLWIQQRVKDGVLKVTKVPGLQNSADMMTKPWTTSK